MWHHQSRGTLLPPLFLLLPPACRPYCCQLHTPRPPTNPQTRWLCLSHRLPLYHITRPPTGQTMNLHSERYGQRRRTAPRLHNDCSESVLVMWFVTPSAPALMWLLPGLGPPVSEEMVASDRRSSSRNQEVPSLSAICQGNTVFGNVSTARMSGDQGGVFTSMFVRVWMN